MIKYNYLLSTSDTCDLSIVQDEIKISIFASKYINIYLDAPLSVIVAFNIELSIEEKTLLDNFVLVMKSSLKVLKIKRELEIDNRTAVLCLSGYFHEPFNAWFSTSAEAQQNWADQWSMMDEYDEYGLWEAGVPMPTLALDGSLYLCHSRMEYKGFRLGMMMARQTIVAQGTIIKNQIKACNTKEEIDAIIDPR